MSGRIRMVSWGALALAAVVVVYLIASSGSNKGYTVMAEFRDVDGLRQGATVKVAGIPAGIISKLVVTKKDLALATLTLHKGAAPIGAGASIQVRPTDLLGEHYAQLNLGNTKDPQPSGTLIPASRTSTPVELDQVLDTLSTPVRARLQVLINEAGVALAGRGANFNQLLADLPPNLTQATNMLSQVSSEDTALEDLIHEGNKVTTAVNAKRDDMGRLIGTAEQALDSVAIKQSQLAQTLHNAPSGLDQLRATLVRLASTSTAIIPAAKELQSTAGPLTGTLKQLPSLASAANPTLQTAVKVAPALTRLGNQGQAPLKALRPTASDVAAIANSAVPTLNELDSRAMRDVLWFVENWALATKARDTLGHFVGADLEIDPSTVTSALASLTENGDFGLTGARSHKPVKTTAPKSSNPAQTLSNGVQTTVNKVNKGVGGLTKSLGDTVNKTLGDTTTKLKQVLSGVQNTVGGVTKGLANGLSNTLNGLTGHTNTTSSNSSSGTTTSGVSQLLGYLLGK